MIKVTNRTRDIVTLPAPYQGILMAYRSEILDTTEAEFITAIGGLDTAGGVFTIESVGSLTTPTVTEDTSLGGGGGGASADTGEIVVDATTSGSKHSLTKTKTISKPTVDAPAFFELPAAGLATAYADYIVKDGDGIAATHNITVSSAGGNIDGASTAVISSNYGSLTFTSDGTDWSII